MARKTSKNIVKARAAVVKPSYALPYFGPSAQGRLGASGIMSYMRPSVIDERGLNANLIGAAVLAEKARDRQG